MEKRSISTFWCIAIAVCVLTFLIPLVKRSIQVDGFENPLGARFVVNCDRCGKPTASETGYPTRCRHCGSTDISLPPGLPPAEKKLAK